MIKAEEMKEFEHLLGDRWRKLVVEVEPLRHVEAQKAIEYMSLGSNLMKHTGRGYPHIRLFQLTEDLKRILWFSSTKKIEDSIIHIARIVRIQPG